MDMSPTTTKMDKKNIKRLLLCGFYGAKNLGDELMLMSLLKALEKVGNFDITILVSDINVPNIKKNYAPHKVIPYPQTHDGCLKIANDFDCMIWGGGAMIDDIDCQCNDVLSLSYVMLETSLQMCFLKKDVIILGVSSNEQLTDKKYIEKLKKLVDEASFFSVRDKNTKNTLRKANIKSKKIKFLDDLAINDLVIPKKITKSKKDTLKIGCIFILNEKTLIPLKNFLTDFNSLLNDNYKITFKLIPFYDHFNNDYVFLTNLAKDIPQEYTTEILTKIPNNINELENILLDCDVIISMRYHGLLIASLLGIHAISLNFSTQHRHYKNKIDGIQRHYNRKIFTLPFDDKKITYRKRKKFTKYLKQKIHPIKKSYIKKSKKKLIKILKKSLNI